MSLIAAGGAHRGSVRGFYPKTIEGSLRFNDDDSAYLSWTPASAGNRKTWTFSAWVKRAQSTGNYQRIFACGDSNDNYSLVYHDTGNYLTSQIRISGTNYTVATAAVYRDHSAWYHIVVEVDCTNAIHKLYVNGQQITEFQSTPTNPPNSNTNVGNTVAHYLGKNSESDQHYFEGYMAEVFFIDGTAHDADAFGETKNGVWVPKNITSADFDFDNNNSFHLTFQDDTEVEAFNTVLYRGTGGAQSITGMGFQPDLVWVKRRDSNPSHSLSDAVRGASQRLFSDTTAAEDANSGIVSFDSDGFTIDGIRNATGSNGSSYVAWAWDAGANNAVTGHSSVTYSGNNGVQKISGFPFSPDLLWVKRRTGGTADHQLYDQVRGASNSLETSTVDEQANVSTMVSFDSNGFNLNGANTGLNNSGSTYVAWAWDAGDNYPATDTSGTNVTNVTRKTSTANGFSIIDYTVTSANNSATKLVPHGLGGNPDWMMIKKYTNNASDNQRWAVYHSALADDQFLKLGDEATDGAGTSSSVFDDSAFTTDTFAVGSSGMVGGHPSFDESYICYAWKAVSGKSAFGTYTGTGSSQTIQTGFRVGWLMVKATSTSGQSWFMIDGSRSPFNNNDVDFLAADTSGVEQSSSVNDIDFHETDGFTVKGTGNLTNGNLVEYVYMAFAGSYSDYITDYNTDGSIDSRVKANDTYGFSIVSYIGNGNASQTVGHGLGSAPTGYMVIIKNRTDTGPSWQVWHSGNGGVRLKLDTTDDDFGNLALTFGTDTLTLPSGNSDSWDTLNKDYIAYCWAEKSGYSKFGSYTGTGSAGKVVDGLGFTPAFVMVKRTDSGSTGAWVIWDATRSATDPRDNNLYAIS